MKIIDAHIHFVPEEEHFARIAALAGHENTAEHLEKVYGQLDIRHAVVMGNRDLTFERHRYPPFMSYCIGLDSTFARNESIGEAAGRVEAHLQRDTCVGIKLYPGYVPVYVHDEIYTPIYQLAEKYGKPVAIHTGATSLPRAQLKYSHPLTLDEVAAKWKRVQFVMCHFGNPWVVDAAAVLSKNRNVAADLSGILEGLVSIPDLLEENRGYVEHLRTWLGYISDYDRILYGTDWPLANISSYIRFTRELIPEKHWEKVFFDNAKRIYGLDGVN